MRYPNAAWMPVANFGPGLEGSPLGLVVHVQEGNGSLYGYFNAPSSGVSSHWWIGKTGQVEQYIDTGQQSWAQEQGNLRYLSVETEGFHTEPLTVAQLDALKALIEWVCASFVVPRVMVDHGQLGITTHAFYPSGLPDPAWGNHACPGPVRSAQLPALVAPAPPNPPVPSLEEADVSTFVVQSSGNDSEWLCNTVSGTIRYLADATSVNGWLSTLGQAKVIAATPSFLSGFSVQGPAGPGIGS